MALLWRLSLTTWEGLRPGSFRLYLRVVEEASPQRRNVSIVSALPPASNVIRTAGTHARRRLSRRDSRSQTAIAADSGCDPINHSEIHKLCQKVCNSPRSPSLSEQPELGVLRAMEWLIYEIALACEACTEVLAWASIPLETCGIRGRKRRRGRGQMSERDRHPVSAISGQPASLSEMTVIGSGQEIPNSGSSQRNPCSPFGSYGPLTWYMTSVSSAMV
jgi:hypothetical protein